MSKASPLPSQDTLREFLVYCPLSGRLTWRHRNRKWFKTLRSWSTWNGKFAGKPAINSNHKSGYLAGTLNWQPVLAHRVIWKLVFGTEPDQIDHENGVRNDNRLHNLRDANNKSNSRNRRIKITNTTGIPGVGRHGSRFIVWIGREYRGVYRTLEEAKTIRKVAENELDYHPNCGRSDDQSYYPV